MKPLEPVAAYRTREATPADADADLVARMQRGDEHALGLLYDRWEYAVRTVAIGIVGDAVEAEDVVEDVFWQAWRQADRFEPQRGSAGSWLVTIARSRALDHRRAARRSREDAGLEDVDEAVVSQDVDPLEELERGERSRRLHDALGTLPAEQRQSLELAYFAGLSQTEIATRTGLALGTVKTRMRLAMQKLRAALSETGERTT